MEGYGLVSAYSEGGEGDWGLVFRGFSREVGTRWLMKVPEVQVPDSGLRQSLAFTSLIWFEGKMFQLKGKRLLGGWGGWGCLGLVLTRRPRDLRALLPRSGLGRGWRVSQPTRGSPLTPAPACYPVVQPYITKPASPRPCRPSSCTPPPFFPLLGGLGTNKSQHQAWLMGDRDPLASALSTLPHCPLGL